MEKAEKNTEISLQIVMSVFCEYFVKFWWILKKITVGSMGLEKRC